MVRLLAVFALALAAQPAVGQSATIPDPPPLSRRVDSLEKRMERLERLLLDTRTTAPHSRAGEVLRYPNGYFYEVDEQGTPRWSAPLNGPHPGVTRVVGGSTTSRPFPPAGPGAEAALSPVPLTTVPSAVGRPYPTGQVVTPSSGRGLSEVRTFTLTGSTGGITNCANGRCSSSSSGWFR